MAILTERMQRLVREQRLGFVATTCPDGTPNLSPKGTTTVWDGDHLVFADIASPGTVENLRRNPAVEVNVVDPMIRKGWRSKGTATVLTDGPRFAEIVAFYAARGIKQTIRSIVLIRVERALPVVSPGYEEGVSEDEMRRRWEEYWASLKRGESDERSRPVTRRGPAQLARRRSTRPRRSKRTPSTSSSSRCVSAQKSPRWLQPPAELTTRCQGTTWRSARGRVASAVPTARALRGAPSSSATRP